MRLRILTISTLAFIVMICFVIDGEVLFGEGGIINGGINEADLSSFQLSIYKLSALSGLGQLLILKILILTFALAYFVILTDQYVVLSSIVMWFVFWIICNSGIGFVYGADFFVIFLLYYNIILSVFRNNSKVYRNLILILQLQLCVVYFFAGFGKMVGANWWDGNALWAVINVYSVDFIKDNAEIFLDWSLIIKALSIGTILLELLYPILIFYKRTRKIALFSVIAMHLGIGIVIGLYTFSVVMISMNLIAFGSYLNLRNPFPKIGRKKVNYETLST